MEDVDFMIRRERLPINPCHFSINFGQFRTNPLSFKLIGTEVALRLPVNRDIVTTAGIRVLMKGSWHAHYTCYLDWKGEAAPERRLACWSSTIPFNVL